MTWQFDPQHTTIQFAVKHILMSTVRGTFQGYDIDADIDLEDLTNSRARITLDTTAITTGSADRDAHLRSADFFDVENHPTVTFETRRIEKTGENDFRVVGDLTVKGITREVMFEGEAGGPITDPWGGTRVALSVEGKVNRKEFGMTWNAPLVGGAVVGDVAKLSLEAELVQLAEAAIENAA